MKVGAQIKDKENKVKNLELVVNYLRDGEFELNIENQPRQLKPGQYQIEIFVQDDVMTNGETVKFIKDFTWGVLALNTNKSIYYIHIP